MTSSQARIGVIASLLAVLGSLAGIVVSIGPPTGPLLDTSVLVDAECPPSMQISAVNFPPEAALTVTARPEDGEWRSIAVDARSNELGEAVVGLPPRVLLEIVGECSPQDSPAYQFRVSANDDTSATSEVSPLNDFPDDIRRDSPPPVGDAFRAPWLFPIAILGLLGMLVFGALWAYPIRSE